jgi:hypothetical protein
MVRQIVRRDREGFEPLVPRKSSARGTEGSNPSSSSGESIANLSFRAGILSMTVGCRRPIQLSEELAAAMIRDDDPIDGLDVGGATCTG